MIEEVLMSVHSIRCTVADPTTAIVYDVAADYRETCGRSHDSQGAHLCELTLRARPMQKVAVPSTVCDIAMIPTAALVAIQTRLRDLGGYSATPSDPDSDQTTFSVVP
jgi:hypothetical protein